MAKQSHPRRARCAQFRFYEELNDFLPEEQRKKGFEFRFSGTPSVKDSIQAIRVPHTAVDLVLVDGRSVSFDHPLKGGERVAVYPEFECLDITPLVRLRARPLRHTRFVLDVHLGKLTRYLRMLGFDCVYDTRWSDAEIIDLALREHRVILTRDRGILKQSRVTHGYWLRHHRPLDQAREVLAALDLDGQVKPFTRCIECNGPIGPATRADLKDLVRQEILESFDEFRQCADCRRAYWKGSHYDRMVEKIQRLRRHGSAGT